MSSPITRPLETEGGELPSYPLPITSTTGTGHSVHSEVNDDHSSNKPMPYIWFNGVIAALALGLSITGIILSVLFWHKADVAENHWRNDEVDIRTLQSDVKKLETQNANTEHAR